MTVQSDYYVKPGKIHHIGMVVRAGTNQIQIWAEGDMQAHSVKDSVNGIRGSSQNIVIGPMNADYNDSKAIYILDEFALSKRARNHAYFVERMGILYDNTSTVSRDQIEVSDADWPSRLKPPAGLRIEDMWFPTPVAKHLEKDISRFDATVKLGRILFEDHDITGKNIACIRCHDPNRAFADPRNRRFSPGRDHNMKTLRNSPTIFNRAFSTHQFADGRARNLTEKVVMPLTDPNEMAGSMSQVLKYLSESRRYPTLFSDAFGTPSITEYRLKVALASFVLTLMDGNSFFDRLESDRLTATDKERDAFRQSAERGAALFRGKARCTGCHAGNNYTDESFHNIGTSRDTDLGRYQFERDKRMRGAFKTPTLRSVRLTAPYFHDGSAATLEDVIDHYNEGGTDRADDFRLRKLNLTD